ncbi:transposase [candidate division CSSED10-310 bacterium]|uniref:Transposase n=1 Tax=candidate division CSSED10-310 bacterium TaxID=2855610 RepID=A0ABV6Z1S9_UNCC1
MKLASIVEHYYYAYLKKYGDTALPSHLKALQAIRRCRTPDSGEFYVQCPDCHYGHWVPLSCGHRSCPHCQNHEASQWIARQQKKLLPVHYFMLTFTIPYELRTLAWQHQRDVYSLMFRCVCSVLKDFALSPKHLGAEIGMTMVLHTHTRKLDYHPHLHVVVPGGGVDKKRRQWKKKKGKYLFNHTALALVFRARLLTSLHQAGLAIPTQMPEKWVVDCAHVGTGITAIKYLSRYLYRGVISEQNIVSDENGQVTFRYSDSSTGETCYRTVAGETFLDLLMHHVLPKGFRRVRDYGFLHANAKKLLALVQLILQVCIARCMHKSRPVMLLPCLL